MLLEVLLQFQAKKPALLQLLLKLPPTYAKSKDRDSAPHTLNPLQVVYILFSKNLTILYLSYFIWEAGRPHTPAFTGV